MKIAIFDYEVTRNNAIGSCHLRILRALCREHEFTVFAVAFENPCPERIHWVRIPVPRRPLALLFLTYHAVAPLYYMFHRLIRRERFSLVQIVESTYARGDISYAHFCHRAYLRNHWKDSAPAGLRGFIKWLAHWLTSWLEPAVFKKVKLIIVPSQGLAKELSNQYPWAKPKIRLLPNPVDVDQLHAPNEFNRDLLRLEMGINPMDLGVVFLGLGHFERKGLPLLLDALTIVNSSKLKLVIVGGTPQLVSFYRHRVDRLRLGNQVYFAGMQHDVRPYLWSADVFALPSFYEVFPLVVLEAAAAGLPLLVTVLNGVEEFVVDGDNGFLVDKTCRSVAAGLNKFLQLSPERRRSMGKKAQLSVERYSSEYFIGRWRKIYESI